MHWAAHGQTAARGWQEDVDSICIFQARWDGGDDTDPSVKPDDGYTGAGHCAGNDGLKA